MSTTAATTVTSLDGFHATPTAQRADESVDWVRAYQSFGLLSEEVDDA